MSWAPWQPDRFEPWDEARVVHLHRRAGFGASWDQIQRDLREGHASAIDRVLEAPRSDSQPVETMLNGIGDAAVGSNNPQRLKAWWLLRMMRSPDPLTEKVALMWHNHFATSNSKVKNLASMRRQNELFRSLGTGNFGQLLNAVVRDPAMLIWLDAPSNRKGRPNENLAREIMELFTLGIGNYTEQDVREAARALTGWQVAEGAFRYTHEFHDEGEKTVLGKTGMWTGAEFVAMLVEHPATAKRLAWRICHTLMGEGACSDSDLETLAAGLRERNLNIRWAIETVLRSAKFFAAENVGTRVCDPVDFAVSSVIAIEFDRDPTPSTLKMARWISELGQDLFYPPNVGGWSGGRNWLTTHYIVARANYAAALAGGRLSTDFSSPKVGGLLEKYAVGKTVDEAVSFFNRLLFGGRLTEKALDRALDSLRQEDVPKQDRSLYALALLLALPEAQVA